MTKSAASKPRALGKGLESLLPSRQAPAAPIAIAASAVESTGKPLEIDVELIDRNPFQTRTNFDDAKLTELAISITASGVVQPVVVRHGVNHRQDGRYTLITGERRLLASKKAGKLTIPAIVREVSNLQAMEMTIVENLQRADLNPMEQAHAYVRLSRDFHMTQEQMAERTGKDRASVSNFLRLLKLPESVQRHVELGELSFGHARALLALESPEAILAAAQKWPAVDADRVGNERRVRRQRQQHHEIVRAALSGVVHAGVQLQILARNRFAHGFERHRGRIALQNRKTANDQAHDVRSDDRNVGGRDRGLNRDGRAVLDRRRDDEGQRHAPFTLRRNVTDIGARRLEQAAAAVFVVERRFVDARGAGNIR